MITLIDHYDSFVHNLARYFEQLGHETCVIRYHSNIISDIVAINPDLVILSPGPKAPKDIPASIGLIRELSGRIPILGVCLGHQCIVEAFDGQTKRAAKPVHGMASTLKHDGKGLFMGVPDDIQVGRYHSLVSELGPGSPLNITAQTLDGEIMAVQHKSLPVYGVQFHPESILTEHGMDMLHNLLSMAAHEDVLQRHAA